jgi:hypothetical protein
MYNNAAYLAMIFLDSGENRLDDLITYVLSLLMVFLRLSFSLLIVNPWATDTEVWVRLCRTWH